MRNISIFTAISWSCVVLAARSLSASLPVTPVEWLRQQTPPRFKPGHDMPRLGQMHCVNPPAELRAELALHWGFAVRLSRPGGEEALLRLCAETPAVFQPAAMIGNLANLESDRSRTWPEGTFLRKADGALVEGRPIFSPEMPEAAWRLVIEEALRQIDGQLGPLPAEALVAIENWTEHGLTVPIHMAVHGAQDPKVVAAKGDRSWQDYTSARKAYYEKRMAEALKQRYPKALHTAYTYSGFVGKSAGDWAWDYRHMKTATDLPSPECYYNYYNTGFVGTKDMLTWRLLGRHIEIQEGSPHYFGWLCGGYQRNIAAYQGDPSQGLYADLPRWMGYLKMSYLAGMLGGITTGEFDCGVRYEPFDPARPPRWLDQIPVLAHAHALFTWLETDLRQSRLLPGPKPHAWNQEYPSYEFPTGHPQARALVRQIRNSDRWLVGAWAADGIERVITVEVPDLGSYQMSARPEGTVHLVQRDGDKLTVHWLDEAGMTPSLTASQLDLGGLPSSGTLSQKLPVRQISGLEVTALGKHYQPDPKQVMIFQSQANTGGNTSVRNTDSAHLEWKKQGYFQRNRDLGQVFTAKRDSRLEAIVLRTGPDTGAVLSGAPGAKVFLQFFEVAGAPRIHDNGTPPGTEARHGFSKNHRCDDFLTGVEYRPLLVVTGGVFPELPPTRDFQGESNGTAEGRMVYLRWRLEGEARPRFEAGKRYAFMVGFEEPGRERGFTLANANAASVNEPPRLNDAHDRYQGGWGLRREGDGTLPPTMFPGPQPPGEAARLQRLRTEALFAEGESRFRLSPTTDGFPDVDTYRDMEFYLEESIARQSSQPSPEK